MQKHRMINTKIWDDDYFSNLDPSEKLMFMYFLTNTSTNIAGIYEIPLKKIAVETGLDKEMVIKIIHRFTRDNKVYYADGWLCLKNFVKNQKNESPTVQTGIKNEIALVPKDILEKFIQYGYSMDTTSNLIKSNLIKSNLKKEESRALTTKEEKKKYGEFENVLLTDFEFEKLCIKIGENNTKVIIEELSSYIASKGARYKNHYATLIGWARRKYDEHKEKLENKRKIV